MDQAQTAIEAAKAAEADRYAADDYRAAVDALAKSHTAVKDKDYRLALNHALDSRDRAQTAAKTATDTRTQMRTDVERTLAGIVTPLADAHTRIAAAQKAHAAPRLLRTASASLAAIEADVQEAGAAQKAGDYAKAQSLLKNIRARITEATAPIGKTAAPSNGRRRR